MANPFKKITLPNGLRLLFGAAIGEFGGERHDPRRSRVGI